MDGYPYTVQSPRQESAVIKWVLNDLVSREEGTLLGLAADTAYEIGTVLGQILVGAAVAAAHAGNTGNGVLTPNALGALDTGAQVGVYNVVCIGGTLAAAAAAAHAGNAGNGVFTEANPAVAANAPVGTYTVVVLGNGATAQFAVYKPNGELDGLGEVGTAYAGSIKFTLADGVAHFASGDSFTVAVTETVAAGGGVFSVTAPDGTVLANATVGVAYDDQIKFTIAAGAADFVVGDSFTVTVAAGSEKYVQFDPAGVDGRQIAAAVLFARAFIPANTDVDAGLVTQDAIVLSDTLIWIAGITAPQITAALAQLATNRIKTLAQA